MAWIAFSGAMAYPLLALVFDNDVITKLATHYYTFSTTVVMVYISGAVIDHYLQKETPNDRSSNS